MKERRLTQPIFYFLAIIVTICTILLMNGPFLHTKPLYEIVTMEDGWTVSYQNKTMEGIRLDMANSGTSKAGDRFEAVHVLPATEVPGACIRVSTVLCALDISVDGVSLYSFGHDRGGANRMIPTRVHFVALPENYAGKELRLCITAYSDNAFSGFYPVSVGNREDIQTQMMQNYRMPLFSGIFLIIFSFVLIIMSVYLVVYETSSARIYTSAAMLLVLGFYILSFYDLIDILTNRPELRTLLEYGSFYLMPATAVAYVASITQGIARRVLGVVSGVFLLAALVSYGLHALNLCFLYEVLPFFQVLFILGIVPLLVYLIYVILRGNRTVLRESDANIRTSEAVLLGGVAYLFVAAIFDMARYAYLRFFSNTGSAYADIQTITHGSLVFAACLIVNYFYYSIDFLNAQVVKERMRGLAYTDPLTGLANRTRCEEVMQRLHSKTSHFVIVSLDVNELKETNDSYGHAQGDRLLKGFADILATCFGEEAYLIGRMGGDEFIAIFKEKPESRVRVLLQELTQQMSVESGRDYRLAYAAAYGVATSKEMPDSSAHDIYMVADSRMYADKKAGKKDKEGNAQMTGGQTDA